MNKRTSKYDNTRYRIGTEPGTMKSHNERTWSIVQRHLSMNTRLHYQTLATLALGHVSGTTNEAKQSPSYMAASFVRYAIRSGWLKVAAP